MTVRLLAARPPYPINAIVTLDAGTEADLIEQGEASANLTGGTVYNAPAAPTYAAPLMAVTPVGQAPAMLQAASIPKIEAVVSEYENGTLGGGGNAAELMQRPMTVGFAGDSIASGWKQRNGDSPLWWAASELWPCEYETVLATDMPGTSSSTLISSQIAVLEAMETPPDVVIVQSIQNDYVGNIADADERFANYKQYAERAIAAGVSLVCLCSRPPKSSPPDSAAALQYLNRKIENYCRATPGMFYVDVMSVWRRKTVADTSGTPWHGTSGQSDAFSNDGVHPTMSACRAAAPLIVPVLQKYARPTKPLISAPIDYDDATTPYGNLMGKEGLMIGTSGRLNGANNSGVAGSAANTFKRWEITDGNGITATPSIVIGPDGYRYQRIDLSGTASAEAKILMHHEYLMDVSAGIFVAEATVIVSGLTGVKEIGFNAAGFGPASGSSGYGSIQAIDLPNSTFRFRTEKTPHSNGNFSSRSNDIFVTFIPGTVVSGYIMVGHVDIHRVA